MSQNVRFALFRAELALGWQKLHVNETITTIISCGNGKLSVSSENEGTEPEILHAFRPRVSGHMTRSSHLLG